MRSISCMTAALVLAAGVSARADVVGMLNVPGGFTNTIRVADLVDIDTNGVRETLGTFSSVVAASTEGNQDSPLGSVCSVANLCGASVGALDANALSVPLPAENATRSAEPSSVALLGTSLIGFAAVMRRRFVG
jgi:hypothetical protein